MVSTHGSSNAIRKVSREWAVMPICPIFPAFFAAVSQRAAGGADLLQIRRGRVVNLVQVNIVGAEIFQADVNVLRHGLRRAGHALGGKHEMLPNALKANA